MKHIIVFVSSVADINFLVSLEGFPQPHWRNKSNFTDFHCSFELNSSFSSTKADIFSFSVRLDVEVDVKSVDRVRCRNNFNMQCSDNADCEMTASGRYRCKCKPGFWGDGFYCGCKSYIYRCNILQNIFALLI